ncbi:AEC family transporter [Luxibacter massiliensis]|uniref:AEC family transporter n=1 Tax=Luxibacter massiliensis TaxID=2219695 RepID=UPI000F04FE67|nr:AEC family transporter [Luxibacter massiliensis]
MENLIFSLNAAMPVFLLMLLGMVFKKAGWIDGHFAAEMNRFVFLVPLPVLVFRDLATVDFSEVWDGRFVIFCFTATILSILISAFISRFLGDRSLRGEFIQASYRSSAALLGIAFIQNIYGSSGLAPLMIIGSVPLYNIMAVIILSLSGPEEGGIDRKILKQTAKGILRNPIILGIIVGIVWSVFQIPMPQILGKTLENIAAMATPMGLIAMGAAFDIRAASEKVGPAALAGIIKLIGFCALFLPAAIYLGFRREELVAILVMLGSATTVSCYVMAKNMGHEGVLTSSIVMLTTLCSSFTLTFWLFILKSLGML